MIDYPIEPLPLGWEVYCNQSTHYLEIVNKEQGIRYRHEPLSLIAKKCFGIFLGIPFYTFAYMAWHCLRAPLTFLSVTILSIEQGIANPSWKQGGSFLSSILWTAPATFVSNIWAVVKAFFYAIGMQIGGLYGVCNPLRGRAAIGWLERHWHNRTRYEDQGHFHQPLLQKIWEGLTDPNNRSTLFLAYCMQPLGELNPQVVPVTEESRVA